MDEEGNHLRHIDIRQSEKNCKQTVYLKSLLPIQSDKKQYTTQLLHGKEPQKRTLARWGIAFMRQQAESEGEEETLCTARERWGGENSLPSRLTG
ncbi:hypothetical protein TNIN_76821 [Trichonephila inaurata madagascariensis]|uniref:Uncharacterized protein n=1 Tax=Trichonephila inaurata madagascariensis TaxID=2747483 RepID=A0A8X6XCN0_9ARAC|nr:hypothetical protein TNIN_76821 [Trichonephila inaurata madagascariensis]